MVLTGTDALRLDTTERPYRSRPRFARQSVTRLALILRMLVTCNDDVGTHSLCVRCRTARKMLISSPLTGTDAQTERPYRSRPRFARQIVTRLALILRMLVTCNDDVGTHGLCVRCVKGYSVVILTGTDARPCGPTNRYAFHRIT